jgi:hypothetical protein
MTIKPNGIKSFNDVAGVLAHFHYDMRVLVHNWREMVLGQPNDVTFKFFDGSSYTLPNFRKTEREARTITTSLTLSSLIVNGNSIFQQILPPDNSRQWSIGDWDRRWQNIYCGQLLLRSISGGNDLILSSVSSDPNFFSIGVTGPSSRLQISAQDRLVLHSNKEIFLSGNAPQGTPTTLHFRGLAIPETRPDVIGQIYRNGDVLMINTGESVDSSVSGEIEPPDESNTIEDISNSSESLGLRELNFNVEINQSQTRAFIFDLDWVEKSIFTTQYGGNYPIPISVVVIGPTSTIAAKNSDPYQATIGQLSRWRIEESTQGNISFLRITGRIELHVTFSTNINTQRTCKVIITYRPNSTHFREIVDE